MGVDGEQVFISYRRADSVSTAGRIKDKLVSVLGIGNVMFDLDTIPFGVDFRTYLDKMVSDCEYMLVIIGPNWLTAADAQGRRLDHADDWVRIEIESALKRGIPVAPVLIDGAQLPGAMLSCALVCRPVLTTATVMLPLAMSPLAHARISPVASASA